MQQLKNNIVVVSDENTLQKYKNDIIKIWKMCFGDSEEYINLFLNNYLLGNCVLLIEDNIAVSMLFLLDCKLKIQEKIYDGKYVYAVATLKEYRKKGYTTKLLNFANNEFIINNNYDFTVLVPSEKELFGFYKNRGYENYFYCEKGTFSTKNNLKKEYNCSNIDFFEYKKIRDEILSDNYIKWDKNFINYCFRENEFLGGQQIKIFEDNKLIAICLLIKNKKELILREIIFAEDFYNKEEVFEYLLKKFHCLKLEYKSNLNKSSKKTPFGMIKWKESFINTANDGYIGLVLD